MNRSRILTAAMALGVGLTLLPGSAIAATTTTYTYQVSGTEVYAAPTTGVFVGTASGAADGAWWTEVDHERLGSDPNPRKITGGSFTLTLVQSNPAHVVSGDLSDGGLIETLQSGAGCTNQVYRVHGPTSASADGQTGDGAADVTLTHHRTSILGHCIIYAATVSGAFQVTLPIP